MPPVTIRDGRLWFGNVPVPLLAGEVHYWRLRPACWPDCLGALERLGLGVVSTYVCWHFHELAPARFDFTGATDAQRNLVGFLELARDRNLRVFIRPGPYIYSEWTNAGVPDRVVTLPRLSEAYRAEARVWMKAVVDAIRPFFATQAAGGGPVVLFQPDNEMDLFSHWFEDACGLGARRTPEGARVPASFFQAFLRERYPSVEDLNEAWGTELPSHDEAQPLASCPDPLDARQHARHADYWRFQHWATREALRWHIDEYRRLGVDLPMVANYYPGGDVQNWREVARSGASFQGIDWYPRDEFARDPEHHRAFLDSCRLQRVHSPIPFIAEFAAGVWHGWHEHIGAPSARHYRLMACSALLAGITSFNWYMLVNRDNWYFSPVGERGEIRAEFADTLTDIHRVWREVDPPALEKLASACACLDATQIGTDNLLSVNPVLRALHEADADFDFLDPELGRIARPLLFYAGAGWLAHDAQTRLLERVEAGATLVLFRRPPFRDEHFRPCDALGLMPPDRVLSHLGKKLEVELGAHTGIAEGPVWVWDDPPGEPITGTQIAGRQQTVECADAWMRHYIGRRWVCGYRERRARGSVIVLGVDPSPSLVRALHAHLGLPLHAAADLPGVRTALFRSPAGAHVLVGVNLDPSPRACRVALDALDPSAPLRATDLFTGRSHTGPGGAVTIDLSGASGGVWRLEPA